MKKSGGIKQLIIVKKMKIKVVETSRILIFFLYFNHYFERQPINSVLINLRVWGKMNTVVLNTLPT